MTAQAKAIRIHSYGGPEVQVLEGIEVAPPGPGQILVRQTVVGVNYLDIYHRRGEAQPVGGLPFVNGFEGVGVVEAVADEGVGDLRPGQRVGYTLAIGAYATHRLVPAARVVPLPDTLSDATAAAVLLKGTTAEYLVRRLYPVGPGDVVLVHAAAGGVGLLVTQWARHLGATVIGTVGSDAKAEIARYRGRCHHVIVAPTPDSDFVTPIRAIVRETGVSVVYDGVAGPGFARSLDLLRPRGMAVVLGSTGGKAPPLDVHTLKARSLTVTSPSLPHFTTTAADYHSSVSAVIAAVRDGAIRAEPGHSYPLADAAIAHAHIESRRTSGSVVLLTD